MNDIYLEHINITKEIKLSIKEMQVVFPAYYGKLYSDIAHKHNIELGPNELFNHEMLDDKIVRHIISLSTYAEDAIEAMETSNKVKLKEVLEETIKLREEIHELQKMVYEDTLTKSHNRKWFEDTFLEADKNTFFKSGTIGMVDLNRFKRINDEFGHVVGDKVLIHVANKLKTSGAEVVRYGGDEFLVVFDESISLMTIEKRMQTLVSNFEKIAFKSGEREFKVTFAYGLAHFKHNDTLCTILDYADKQMYQLKQGRRKKGEGKC